jgi:hypothetical protein
MERTMNRLAMMALAAFIAVAAPVHAQQRTNNSGAPGMLRQWPVAGVWRTLLARSIVTHDLACAMFTGYNNQNSGERYAWGIRRAGDVAALEIIDSNPAEVAGPSISVTIDGLVVGTYSITRRLAVGDATYVIAELSKPNADSLLNLVRLGGAIKFTTNAATYSASLMGVRAAMMNLDSCVLEMTQLDAAQVSAQR